MNTDSLPKKKLVKPIERVTIEEALKIKLVNLTTQANQALQGIANITKSDVMNMILADHPGNLSAKEIEQLKATHIDQVKLALWLANEVRSAKKSGQKVTLQELLSRCESVLKQKQSRRRENKAKNKDELKAINKPDLGGEIG